jgi:asparagine synthase (glutamine-hydrolysing)
MCGIGGILRKRGSGKLETRLRAMGQSMMHRGPEDHGVWEDDQSNVGFAHQRLSIVDLSPLGKQPMQSKNGRYHITYNGEIYNFPELRNQLLESGFVFRGSSDTEVLIESISLWGLDPTLEKLIGMFAFALWDMEERVLTLARDRMGIKPLYYSANSNQLTFSSELRGILIGSPEEREIEPSVCDQFLRYGYVDAPTSIFKNVKKLLPGHYLQVGLDSNALSCCITAYWLLTEKIPTNRPVRTSKEHLRAIREILSSAVEMQMISDVPIGGFLSGGIDSTTVVALMQQRSQTPINTFTIGFSDPAYNEANHAREIAAYLGTHHHEEQLTEQDLLGLVQKMGNVFDEPFADESQLPTLKLAELARKNVTVCLSGDGGDELFGGYTRHYQANKFVAFQRLPLPLRRFLSNMMMSVPQSSINTAYNKIIRVLGLIDNEALIGDKFHKVAAMMKSRNVNDLYHAITDKLGESSLLLEHEQFINQKWWTQPADKILGEAEKIMLWDSLGYLPEDILTKVDRTTMAVSLEARVPLLDHRLVEYAWSMREEEKLMPGSGKLVLKELLSELVPRKLWERPKMGFSVPIDGWLNSSLRELKQEFLSPSRIEREGLLDHKRVSKIVQAHENGRTEKTYAVWNLLMFELWYDRWHKV